MSVAQNSHLTNKPEANGVLILPLSPPPPPPPPPPPSPLCISAPFYGYLKLLKATWTLGKKLKEGFGGDST